MNHKRQPFTSFVRKAISEEDWRRYNVEIQAMLDNKIIKLPLKNEDFCFRHHTSEPNICKHFGCGQILTPREYLFSDYCIIHNGNNRIVKNP